MLYGLAYTKDQFKPHRPHTDLQKTAETHTDQMLCELAYTKNQFKPYQPHTDLQKTPQNPNRLNAI